MSPSPPAFLASLFRPERRELARRRRLVVLASCALSRPVTAAALSAALGEELSEAVECACERGLCHLLPGGGVAPIKPIVLDMAVTHLSVTEMREALHKLAPLAPAADERLLLKVAADPLGEGLRLLRDGAPGRAAGMAAGLRQVLSTPSDVPQPCDFRPWGTAARWVSALLATTAHVLMRQGQRATSRALMAWALGPEALAGHVLPHHGFLAPTHVQFLLDAGRREQGAAFARQAREHLTAPEDTFSRLMLMVLEARVAIDSGEERLARRLFSHAEMQAREAGLEDLVGLAKVAFATLARRADQNAAAIQLCLAALELFLGDEPFEAVALHNLGLAYFKEGRALEAQAALTHSLAGLDARALSLLGSLRFTSPTRSVRSLGLQGEKESLYWEPSGELAALSKAARAERIAQAMEDVRAGFLTEEGYSIGGRAERWRPRLSPHWPAASWPRMAPTCSGRRSGTGAPITSALGG